MAKYAATGHLKEMGSELGKEVAVPTSNSAWERALNVDTTFRVRKRWGNVSVSRDFSNIDFIFVEGLDENESTIRVNEERLGVSPPAFAIFMSSIAICTNIAFWAIFSSSILEKSVVLFVSAATVGFSILFLMALDEMRKHRELFSVCKTQKLLVLEGGIEIHGPEIAYFRFYTTKSCFFDVVILTVGKRVDHLLEEWLVVAMIGCVKNLSFVGNRLATFFDVPLLPVEEWGSTTSYRTDKHANVSVRRTTP